MADGFVTISPVDGSIVAERSYSTGDEIEHALSSAAKAAPAWRSQTIEARCEAVTRFLETAVHDVDGVCSDLTMQIGRPISQGAGEVRGWLERGHKMVEMAPTALADLQVGERDGFTRFIRHDSLGVVVVLAPWNYPWLTAVNALAPALLAGNTVVLKHAEQTPLVAERMQAAANEAGLPEGVFQTLTLTHAQVANVVADARVSFVAFTGSVEGGHAVQDAMRGRFVGVGLELGGKDPAYVCSDADIARSAANLVDGAFYNAGQSCCGIERIYVERASFPDFVDAFVEETVKLVLDDPRDANTTLGPVVRIRSAEAIQNQSAQALASGARALIDPTLFSGTDKGLPYLAPQVLINVDHRMAVMQEETFGPVIGIMPIDDDAEAIALMNDSRYGLTASIWTADLERACKLGDQVQTGTWFMNRCDYLDPELAWVGVKDSGRGCTLSALGFSQLTRPKSFHLRHKPG